MRRSIPILLAALLGGCLSDASKGEIESTSSNLRKNRTLVFHCTSPDTRFTLRFENDRLWLFTPEFSYSFDRPMDRSDAGTYRNGKGVELHFDQKEASLKTPRLELKNCRWDPKASVWEAAKLDGVDFRAIGEEPPWILEIRGDRVDFYFGYEKRSYRFPHIRIGTESNRTVMETKEFKAVLTPGPCRDSMSGEIFETAVWIEWGGRRLQGCGRALH